MHRRDKGAATQLPRVSAFVGGLATDISLDRIKRGDPPQRLCSRRGLCGDMDVIPTVGERSLSVASHRRGTGFSDARAAIDVTGGHCLADACLCSPSGTGGLMPLLTADSIGRSNRAGNAFSIAVD